MKEFQKARSYMWDGIFKLSKCAPLPSSSMKCQTEINHDNVMHFHHIQKQSSGGVLLNFAKLTGFSL